MLQEVTIRQFGGKRREEAQSEMQGARLIGELAVHRESLERVLQENPQSRVSILEALGGALHQETKDSVVLTESKEEVALV